MRASLEKTVAILATGFFGAAIGAIAALIIGIIFGVVLTPVFYIFGYLPEDIAAQSAWAVSATGAVIGALVALKRVAAWLKDEAG